RGLVDRCRVRVALGGISRSQEPTVGSAGKARVNVEIDLDLVVINDALTVRLVGFGHWRFLRMTQPNRRTDVRHTFVNSDSVRRGCVSREPEIASSMPST